MEVGTLHTPIDLALNAPGIITRLLNDLSAVTDYRILRDSLPARLAALLGCRCVLLYQRAGDTLQFAAGSYDTVPGWSAGLLAVAHINPIDLSGDLPEARAWRSRHAVADPPLREEYGLAAVPLLYRQRAIGVLVAVRSLNQSSTYPTAVWAASELAALEAIAGAVALLLENARLLERDRERIHELALLNTIAGQLHYAMYDRERIHHNIVQRVREITNADESALLLPQYSPAASSWITPALHAKLLAQFQKQSDGQLAPLIVERSGNSISEEYMSLLPAHVKTFFAVPLRVNETTRQAFGQGVGKLGGLPHVVPRQGMVQQRVPDLKLHGMIAGVYHRTWKLRREELVMLQILANQASAALENIDLMISVIEARNEARKLLRQVLDDQRIKETILRSVPGGLLAVDLNERIQTFNRAAGSILGYDAREAIGQPLQSILRLPEPLAALFAEEGRSTVTVMAQRSPERSSGDDQAVMGSSASSSAQEVVLDLHAVPLSDDQGRRIGTLLAFNDITTVHRLEEEKRRLDRLATLGEMAASVAHEVRNPLASIKTSMQMMQSDLEGEQPDIAQARASIAIAQHEVERLDTIVRELLVFSRPSQLHRMPCYLSALCDRVLQLIAQQCLEAGISVHRVYHELPPVSLDAAQMEQVLFNLCTNALQAMPEGGTLTITCQVVAEERTEPVQEQAEHITARSTRRVELAVSDTGSGIAPEHLDRIFQPFFTTKAHGFGLGLSISRRLVEDHGGTLRIESFPGYGSTFTVRLPFAVDQPDEDKL